MTPETLRTAPELRGGEWWRDAVVYQIYPRSFADGDGDGTGDVAGIISRLDHVVELGVDAIWISPWYPSPLADGGYDVADYRDIDPRFGTLAQADELIEAAHGRGLRVIIDLVPNHSSDEHPWFQAALAAGPGSPERDRYIFRDGRGDNGELPPNNWRAMFGGPAWERVIGPDGPEQWYLHFFDVKQPDWNWENPEVVAEFDAILRFWFDRGVDGFRVDVADSLAKEAGLPDVTELDVHGQPSVAKYPGSPMWDQPALADIQRRWRAIADEYADTDLGPRIFVSEAYLSPASRLAAYVEPGRFHTTFNFDALLCEWTPDSQRHVITQTLDAHAAIEAACTWVLGNHDNVRVASRYGKSITGVPFDADGTAQEVPGYDREDTLGMPTDFALGRRRARAAALLELALPGGAYVYQGEELGLPEVEDLPESALQDPTWERSGHTLRGRDGCRVPIPWSGTRSPFGFGDGDAEPWLPMPEWSEHSVEAQASDPNSFWTLYRSALAQRRQNPALGDGTLTWTSEPAGPEVVDFTREPGFRCIVNFGAPVALPEGEILLASEALEGDMLGTDQAVWLRVPEV